MHFVEANMEIPAKAWIGGTCQDLVFLKITRICSNCRQVGHNRKKCPLMERIAEKMGMHSKSLAKKFVGLLTRKESESMYEEESHGLSMKP